MMLNIVPDKAIAPFVPQVAEPSLQEVSIGGAIAECNLAPIRFGFTGYR